MPSTGALPRTVDQRLRHPIAGRNAPAQSPPLDLLHTAPGAACPSSSPARKSAIRWFVCTGTAVGMAKWVSPVRISMRACGTDLRARAAMFGASWVALRPARRTRSGAFSAVGSGRRPTTSLRFVKAETAKA